MDMTEEVSGWVVEKDDADRPNYLRHDEHWRWDWTTSSYHAHRFATKTSAERISGLVCSEYEIYRVCEHQWTEKPLCLHALTRALATLDLVNFYDLRTLRNDSAVDEIILVLEAARRYAGKAKAHD